MRAEKGSGIGVTAWQLTNNGYDFLEFERSVPSEQLSM